MVTLPAQPLIKHVAPIDPRFLEGDRIQPGHPLFGLIWINLERVSGAPCFYGTRVPVKNLFDSLAAGVTREQALAILDLASRDLLHDLERI